MSLFRFQVISSLFKVMPVTLMEELGCFSDELYDRSTGKSGFLIKIE
jgi:hypothetical protein